MGIPRTQLRVNAEPRFFYAAPGDIFVWQHVKEPFGRR
jgi:hypothetical protein